MLSGQTGGLSRLAGIVIRFTAGYPTLQLKGCGEESGFAETRSDYRQSEGEAKPV